MKIKGSLVSTFSKKQNVSPKSKLLKQKKLKSSAGSLKTHKMKVLTKEKLNHVMNNTELIDMLRTKTEDTKLKKNIFSEQSSSQKLRSTKKIDNKKQIKSMSGSINHSTDALKTEMLNFSISAKKLTSKRESKQKDNLKTQSKKQGLEKIKKSSKDKQIKQWEGSFINQEISVLKKVKRNLGIDAAKLTQKHKTTKPKKESLKTQNTIQDSVKLKKIGNENMTLRTTINNPKSVITKKHSTEPNIESHKSENCKQKTTNKVNPKESGSKQNTKEMSYNNLSVEEMCKEQLNLMKVTAAVNALYEIVKEDQTDLLNLAEPIFMEVECIKIPKCPTKQLRFKLPHPLVNELSDILLITADKKGAKIYPDKAVDHYTELLAKHGINFIQEVIPLRSICVEYSQYELRKKLVDQYDMILADATIIKSLGSQLGKHILYKRKMPLPVHLNRKDLKQHFLMTISKTQMTVKGNGHLTSVQVGHTKMTTHEVAANILAVTQTLGDVYPGGFKNIRSLDIKTSNSISLPVFFSLVPSSMVETPVEQPKLPKSVVGELSTQLHSNVVVKADGRVLVRRAPEPSTLPMDDSHDDEILKAAKEYAESAKTIRYDENEDSDDQAEAATDAMEKKLVKNYIAKNKKKEEDGEEDEQEEEESSDEEEEVVLPVGQKRKKGLKNQATEKSPEKKQKKVHHQGKAKESTQKKEVKKFGQIKAGDQKRGSRGGKKQKMNKDQRKAFIKRKKAGKK